MLYLVKWLCAWILPAGGLITVFAAITAYMFYKHAPGRRVLAGATIVFYMLMITPVADGLMMPLEQAYTQTVPEETNGDVIILLGGGVRAGVPDVDGTGQTGEAAANRFLTAIRLQRIKHVPILLSGGAVLAGDAEEALIEKRMLLSLGVPEKDIYIEAKSRNTAENARYSCALCREKGWHHPIVVTSAFHMPRAVYFFQREGMEVTPYPGDYRTSAAEPLSPFSFVPQTYNLMNSCLAVKEYIGMGAAAWGLQ